MILVRLFDHLWLHNLYRAFILQFSRSMHVECWGTGVDFLAVTPYKVQGANATHGTLICPLPSKLVDGTMSQLGKQYVWQGHGYWFHGLLGHLANYYPSVTSRYRKMMKDTRKRCDEAASRRELAQMRRGLPPPSSPPSASRPAFESSKEVKGEKAA